MPNLLGLALGLGLLLLAWAAPSPEEVPSSQMLFTPNILETQISTVADYNFQVTCIACTQLDFTSA